METHHGSERAVPSLRIIVVVVVVSNDFGWFPWVKYADIFIAEVFS